MIYGRFNQKEFQGHFDSPIHAGSGLSLEGKGYALQAEGPRTQLYCDAQLIVVCVGHPRIGDSYISTESLASTYRTRGQSAIEQLCGNFVVVILDALKRQASIFTDRFAAESMCYSEQDGSLHFCDRADVLAKRLGRAINEQALFNYLYFHAIPAPHTAFAQVHRLEASTRLTYADAGLRIARYWQPQFIESERRPLQEMKTEFRTLIEMAVKRESALQRTGCFLSGGTDSSTVAGMLTRVSGAPAKSFSIGFDAAGYDEMEYARIAARHFGTEHHEHYLSRDELVRNIPLVAAAYDQPFGNSSAGAAYQCVLVAKAMGVKKLLAGDGGDELFGGNSRYAKHRVFEAYGLIPGFLRTLAIEPVLALPGVSKLPLFSKAASYVEQARVPMPDRMNMYNLLLRLGVAEVLEPGFLAHVRPEEPEEAQREVYAAGRADTLINRMLAFDWKYTLSDSDLPKVCGTTHMAGLEVGFPLLSDELVQFSLRLEPELKLKGLKLRYFFKEALRGFLPDEIITKKKHGFGLPFGQWAMDHAPLRALAFDSLNALSRRGIARPDFIAQLRDRLLPEHPGYYGEMVWMTTEAPAKAMVPALTRIVR